MKLSDLKIGDEIKWDQIVGISDIYTSFGPIIKITGTAATAREAVLVRIKLVDSQSIEATEPGEVTWEIP